MGKTEVWGGEETSLRVMKDLSADQLPPEQNQEKEWVAEEETV